MRAEAPKPVLLKDYRAPDYLIDAVSLDFRLAATATRVEARLSLRPNPKGEPGAPLILDGEHLVLESIALDDTPLPADAYVVGDQTLTLAKPPAEPFTLTIVTRIAPGENTEYTGLYLSNDVYCTQCEAEGFRRITYFLDRPDVLAVYTTRIEARRTEAPVLLSNGNPMESGDVPDSDRHFAVWHDPFPKPSYLFALVAGDLSHVSDTFRTRSGREVDLRIYVEHGKEDRCDYAMDALKRSMRWDEEAFGREYDLDIFMIVAVSYFNMGAMENKGLNIFNDRYVLARPDTATDSDYAGIETVIAHEYFHNWTGDRITCRDWFQLCLKEGLTVFRDQEFTSDERSRPVKRIADVRGLRAQQFAEDSGPLAHPVRPDRYSEINNFYTATVYEKGAEVIRMLKILLGAEGFSKGMDLYFERHDGEAATVEDFLACFADATGKDLTQFHLWYSQSGTPEVTATGSYNPGDQTYALTLEQKIPPTPGQSTKEPMVIPVALGLLGPDGGEIPLVADAPLDHGVFTLGAAKQTVTFRNVPSRPVASLFRGFSAPVKLKMERDLDDLAFLMRFDADPFNRWQAGQDYALRLLIVAARGRGLAQGDLAAFAEACGAILEDPALEPAFVAQALALPGESDVAREMGSEVDPDAIHATREAMRGALGRALAGPLRRAYDAAAVPGPFSTDAASAGRRSLQGACLALLAAAGSPESLALLEAHYDNAANMTDRVAALGILTSLDIPARTRALADFRERYQDDVLVLDKWFALQAMARGRGTLDRVKQLMGDPVFSLSNPNRVRALIGSFAAGNQTEFNRPDGAGYTFVVDIVLTLDAKNPQVAARMLSAFRSWRALESGRRGKAEAALKRVLAADRLSPDVADIANRSLG